MRKSKWEVNVWLNCEQRIGVNAKKIEDHVHAYCQSHVVEFHPFNLHRLENYRIQKQKWNHWCLYCYFIPQYNVVEVIDAAPVQKTKLGKQWLHMVDQHFNVFSMPWRMRMYEPSYSTIVSGGKVAVEKLLESAQNFLDSVKIDPDTLDQAQIQLGSAVATLDKYYLAVETQDLRKGRHSLDHAVYLLHELIYYIGEQLKFVPRKK